MQDESPRITPSAGACGGERGRREAAGSAWDVPQAHICLAPSPPRHSVGAGALRFVRCSEKRGGWDERAVSSRRGKTLRRCDWEEVHQCPGTSEQSRYVPRKIVVLAARCVPPSSSPPPPLVQAAAHAHERCAERMGRSRCQCGGCIRHRRNMGTSGEAGESAHVAKKRRSRGGGTPKVGLGMRGDGCRCAESMRGSAVEVGGGWCRCAGRVLSRRYPCTCMGWLACWAFQ